MEENAANETQAELLKRMMQLKEMYKNIKTQAAPTLVALPPKKPALAADESESDEAEPNKKAPLVRAYVKKANDNVDLAQLQAVMKQVIVDNGGSAHIDTVAEYVKLRWPNLRKKDGSVYNSMDCKRLLQSNMKQLKVVFERDRYHEGCWVLREHDKEGEEESEDSHEFELEDEEGDKSETQANLIANAIDSSNSGATYDEICAYVNENWHTKPRKDEDLRESIKITLTTNPRFKKEARRSGQEVYLIQPRGKRKSAQNVQVIQEVVKGGVDKRRRKQEEEEMSNGEVSDEEVRRGRGRGRGGSIAGRGGRFIPGQAVPLGSRNLAKQKDVKEVKDVNPWICCDGCGKWVQAKQDGIEDISIYDDANPNHLDYYCPKCRKKREDEGLLQPDLKPQVLSQQPAQAPAQSAPPQSAPRGPQSITEADSAGVATRRAKRQLKDDDDSVDAAPSKTSGGAAASALLGGMHNNSRKSARGVRPRKKYDDDDDDDSKSKLDQMERDLLEQFEGDRIEDNTLPADKMERVRLLEKKFEEELSKYKQTLATSRDAIFEKNQKDFDAQVEKLEREKDSLDHKAEEELALQLKDYMEKRRAKLKTMIAEITGDDR